jgi:alanyl-tRNA synthetase
MKLSGAEVRNKFLEYFQKQSHRLVKSSSLVPRNDPTLLFTNAGMVQFKDVFLGLDKRDYRRAATVQKCVRAGGKHNDLENVGRTARHHTFFEMLGNFSFGDYFKEKAIEFGWELLTVDLGLPPQKLYATIYQDDEEAFKLWQKIAGLPADRIVRLGEKDNFWAMGPTGPCGPCSEIVIDQGPQMSCGRPQCAVGCDCDRYLELWNLVFMQYNQDAGGNRTPLPKPSIDTGAGLERITAVKQGVTSNFETDLLFPIIKFIQELAEKKYGQDEKADISMRVIADHARATAFLITDGVLPSNEWRGYVLRRILRRGLRHGKLLGIHEPFMFRVTGVVTDLFASVYPELKESRDYVAKITRNEEERFSYTLEQGLRLLDDLIAEEKAKGKNVLSGDEAFKLYDTFGFPLDLTQDLVREKDFSVDLEGFDKAMEAQKELARSTWKGHGEMGSQELYMKVLEEFGGTRFVGYETTEAEGVVQAIVKGRDLVKTARAGDEVELVLDQTPFYGESGGQVGDEGIIHGPQGKAAVHNTQWAGQLLAHQAKILEGTFSKSDLVKAAVSPQRRKNITLNHTATHLLQAALRRVLGTHVEQSGSLVAPERLRFDFNHFAPMSEQEKSLVEEMVNAWVRDNLAVQTALRKREEAMAEGAMALFGEKYGEQVRVVAIKPISKELCGGTHAGATGDIGFFKIVHEGGVAAGVRRIEAFTGPGAYQYVKKEELLLEQLAEILKVKPEEVLTKAERVVAQLKEQERELERLRSRLAVGVLDTLLEQATTVEGVKVVAAAVENLDVKGLRELADKVKDKLGSGVIVLGSAQDSKVAWVGAVTRDLTDKLHAGNIIKEVAKITGGGGGGRPDMAEAGGKDPGKIVQALESVKGIVQKALEKK